VIKESGVIKDSGTQGKWQLKHHRAPHDHALIAQCRA